MSFNIEVDVLRFSIIHEFVGFYKLKFTVNIFDLLKFHFFYFIFVMCI